MKPSLYIKIRKNAHLIILNIIIHISPGIKQLNAPGIN